VSATRCHWLRESSARAAGELGPPLLAELDRQLPTEPTTSLPAFFSFQKVGLSDSALVRKRRRDAPQ
jgi:hypothetical protein